LKVSIELTLTPLQNDFEPLIKEFIIKLRASGFKIIENPLSTQIYGDYENILAFLTPEIKSNVEKQLSIALQKIIFEKYKVDITDFEFQTTRKEFKGNITLVVFSLLKNIKENIIELGNFLGNELLKNDYIRSFNIIKGFLNIELHNNFYTDFLNYLQPTEKYGHTPLTSKSPTYLVEFSSPNTNKPLHLGHIRNNLLGYSVSKILEANGKKVIKTQIINDRGIHICKSMVAWQKFGKGATPESTNTKGDKFVGNYYIIFDKKYKEEIRELGEKGIPKNEVETKSTLLLEAKKMLQKWEKGDKETLALWKKMNGWVYNGFEKTYKNLGVSFDSLYYESNTFLLGKKIIEEGLRKKVFYKKEDESIWVDLTTEGLDEKLLLRADGTAVYITQDLGTAYQRMQDYPQSKGMLYTVGNEQDYHFKVLFLILKKLKYNWADILYHLSYAMVNLPDGKMKSREGTVVDADDLLLEMTNTAEKIGDEMGKLEALNDIEKKDLYKMIGLGALKYFILKIDPKKNILFNPKESIDFSGDSASFIQYTYARIQSILRKANFNYKKSLVKNEYIKEKEKEILIHLSTYPKVIEQAAKSYNPSFIAHYVYDLVKLFNSFYQNISILGEKEIAIKDFRISLSYVVSKNIANACELLGIEMPDRM